MEIEDIFKRYQSKFEDKVFDKTKAEDDELMRVFGITEEIKKANKQYWSRELGTIFEETIKKLFKEYDKDFKDAKPVGSDKPYDLQSGNDYIDTKYRIGSGDSGTLKKFKQYGQTMRKEGKNPVMLILREDNLDAAITALKSGEWEVYTGEESYKYIYEKTEIDFRKFLVDNQGKYHIKKTD